jgi:hypothetical protein
VGASQRIWATGPPGDRIHGQPRREASRCVRATVAKGEPEIKGNSRCGRARCYGQRRGGASLVKGATGVQGEPEWATVERGGKVDQKVANEQYTYGEEIGEMALKGER